MKTTSDSLVQASLTVVLKPELSSVQDVVVQYYEDTTIQVTVNANPAPDVKWLKDGIEITMTERLTIWSDEGSSSHNLSLTRCELSDSGTYSLLASNTEGESQVDMKITVHCKCFLLLITRIRLIGFFAHVLLMAEWQPKHLTSPKHRRTQRSNWARRPR